MLSAIKTALTTAQVDRILNKANINTSHKMIPFKNLKVIGEKMANRSLANILVQSLFTKIQSNNLSLQLKSLIALHQCFKQSTEEHIADLILQQEATHFVCETEIDAKSPNRYMIENINNFYLVYLKKICAKKSTYKLVKSSNNIPNLLKSYSIIELINHAFKVLNLGTYLLTSQLTFIRTGRYYPDYQEISSLYLQLVQDLNAFNQFIKSLVNYFLKKVLQEQVSQMQQTLDSIYITEEEVIETEQEFREYENEVQNKHMLIFINEAQIFCDNLYQFHNNKFYAPVMKKYILMPEYLEISQKQYLALKKRVRRIDPAMKSQIIKTECDLPYRTRMTNNFTSKSTQKAYENIALSFINTSVVLNEQPQKALNKTQN